MVKKILEGSILTNLYPVSIGIPINIISADKFNIAAIINVKGVDVDIIPLREIRLFFSLYSEYDLFIRNDVGNQIKQKVKLWKLVQEEDSIELHLAVTKSSLAYQELLEKILKDHKNVSTDATYSA
jgi:hypothetical protein